MVEVPLLRGFGAFAHGVPPRAWPCSLFVVDAAWVMSGFWDL